ncbi:MAG: PilZ domain-containing protein [Candidatus Aminicenantales bacterium]
MKEKRREERIPDELKFTLNPFSDTESASAEETYFSLTRDVSAGGARIITNVPLPVDTLCRFEIGLSRLRKIVQGTCRVRWVNRLFEDDIFEIGLEFVDLDAESIGALLEHVYHHGAARP